MAVGDAMEGDWKRGEQGKEGTEARGTPREDREMRGATVNPFVNRTRRWTTYEVCKACVVGPTLFPIRVVLVLLGLLLAWTFAHVSLIGWTSQPEDEAAREPLPGWRRALQLPIRLGVRLVLFGLGYHYIKEIGRPASRRDAPIVVCNHITFVEPCFFFFRLFPTSVASTANLVIPVVGTIMRATQLIPVVRNDPGSAARAKDEIARRARDRDAEWPHVLVFPEGLVHNGTCLVQFKAGAFAPGTPVQPVVVRYPHTHFDPSWVVFGRDRTGEGIAEAVLLVRHMLQFHNFMEVEWLPVVVPTERQARDPVAYANSVRARMASALNVPCTEHSIKDVFLAIKARSKFAQPAPATIELARFEQLLVDAFVVSDKGEVAAHVERYLADFAAMDGDHDGRVTFDEWLHALRLPDCNRTRDLFAVLDKDESGTLDFREFYAGLALAGGPHHGEARTLSGDSLAEAFRVMDANGDGVIDRAELASALAWGFPGVSDAQVDAIFTGADTDKDGKISSDECAAYLRAHPTYARLFRTMMDTNPASQ